MTRGLLIILEGNVGVGKTTTIRLIKERRTDYICAKEEYAQLPCLTELYQCVDKEKCRSLSTQVQCWILSHTLHVLEHAIDEVNSGGTVVLDRSIFGMRPFITLGINTGMLGLAWYRLLEKEISVVEEKLFTLNKVIIHMTADPIVCLSRVMSRPGYIPTPDGRLFDCPINLNEEKIKRLDESYRNLFKRKSEIPVAEVDTTKMTPEEVVDKVLEIIDIHKHVLN